MSCTTTIVVFSLVAAVLYATTCSSCGGRSASTRHTAAHHACLRADAQIVPFHSKLVTINDVSVGQFILTVDRGISSFRRIVAKTCHTGSYRMWNMPNLPEAMTANHPIWLNYKWYSGDPVASLRIFGVNTTQLGNESSIIVPKVCSIDLDAEHSIAFAVKFDGTIFWAAD